jgi:hypothetical protein
MTAQQISRIRTKAANQAHATMAAYTGKDKAELEKSRHNAALKAWATRRRLAKGSKKVAKAA